MYWNEDIDMNIFINLKSVGKRKSALEKSPYTLPDGITSLRHLLETIVRQEVERYNSRGLDNMLIPFLTEAEITDRADVGKVGFGRLYSHRKANPDKAVETALQGFEDGLFRVMIGEAEAVELDETLEIHEGDVLTFIRLTFLAGRRW